MRRIRRCRAPALIRIFLLATLGATLVAPAASAYELRFESSYAGETLTLGDTLVVEVHIDTQGDTGVSFFSATVAFPTELLELDASSSSLASYILYAPGGMGSTNDL